MFCMSIFVCIFVSLSQDKQIINCSCFGTTFLVAHQPPTNHHHPRGEEGQDKTRPTCFLLVLSCLVLSCSSSSLLCVSCPSVFIAVEPRTRTFVLSQCFSCLLFGLCFPFSLDSIVVCLAPWKINTTKESSLMVPGLVICLVICLVLCLVICLVMISSSKGTPPQNVPEDVPQEADPSSEEGLGAWVRRS